MLKQPPAFTVTGGFLPGPRAPIPVTLWLPADRSPRCWVIHVPAFADEMNKGRALVAAQARAFAGQGIATLLPDLLGTGDSALAFEHATVDSWLEELRSVADWCTHQGARRVLFWGLRSGCLLASTIAATDDGRLPLRGLLYWQPTLSGALLVRQFLRLRLAAALYGGRKESLGELRERLLGGETLEVAGYRLSGELLSGLEAQRLLPPPPGCPLDLFEVTAATTCSAALLRWREALPAEHAVALHTAPGDSFWMTQELGEADALQALTTRVAGERSAAWERPAAAVAATLPPAAAAREALAFDSGGDVLLGQLQRSAEPRAIGVLVLVGGPQYRVGSHRQFHDLAQDLVAAGYDCMRFDYRGRGDSGGIFPGFRHVDDDIRAALDEFAARCPRLRGIVLWGLCDAATAALAYDAGDTRVAGYVLANPWVTDGQGRAAVVLRHYYWQRLRSRAFWRKLLGGAWNAGTSLRAFAATLRATWRERSTAPGTGAAGAASRPPLAQADNLASWFSAALHGCDKPVCLLLSGRDLTAAEFRERVLAGTSLPAHVQRIEAPLAQANHTFSSGDARAAAAQCTLRFLDALAAEKRDAT